MKLIGRKSKMNAISFAAYIHIVICFIVKPPFVEYYLHAKKFLQIR